MWERLYGCNRSAKNLNCSDTLSRRFCNFWTPLRCLWIQIFSWPCKHRAVKRFFFFGSLSSIFLYLIRNITVYCKCGMTDAVNSNEECCWQVTDVHFSANNTSAWCVPLWAWCTLFYIEDNNITWSPLSFVMCVPFCFVCPVNPMAILHESCLKRCKNTFQYNSIQHKTKSKLKPLTTAIKLNHKGKGKTSSLVYSQLTRQLSLRCSPNNPQCSCSINNHHTCECRTILSTSFWL